MIVTSLNGTSDNVCNCGSWLQHWKNYSNQTVKGCAVKSCNNDSEVGGHVQKNIVHQINIGISFPFVMHAMQKAVKIYISMMK